jgi:hypothetical protein
MVNGMRERERERESLSLLLKSATLTRPDKKFKSTIKLISVKELRIFIRVEGGYIVELVSGLVGRAKGLRFQSRWQLKMVPKI